MLEFLSKPAGSGLMFLPSIFTAGGIHCNGKDSPVVSMLVGILVGEPKTFSRYSSKYNVGNITTTPTKLLPKENDCGHISIDGKVNCFSINPLPQEKFLSAPTDGFLWDCRSSITKRGTTIFNDVIMWGSTGSLIFQYPPGACDDSGNIYTGTKAIHWYGHRDFMYVAESKCGHYSGAKITSRIRLTKIGLDSTLKLMRTQVLITDVADDGLKPSKIQGLFYDLEAGKGTYKLSSPSPYSSVSNLVVADMVVTDRPVDVYQVVKTLESRTHYPAGLFPGYLTDMSILDEHVDWGVLATQCAQQLNTLSVNGMAYSADIISLRKQIKSVVKLLMDFENPKAWASLYLSFHYGIKLTVSDTRSIMEEVLKVNKHKGYQKLQSSTSIVDDELGLTEVAHLALYYDRCSGAFAELYYKLLEFDSLFSDMENLWDLVPFSFVIDWFVSVGDLLDQLDATNHSAAFLIPAAEYSIKLERSLDPTLFGLDLSGVSLQARYYHRRFIPEAPTLSYSLDVPINQGFGHWVESGALILQKFFS